MRTSVAAVRIDQVHCQVNCSQTPGACNESAIDHDRLVRDRRYLREMTLHRLREGKMDRALLSVQIAELGEDKLTGTQSDDRDL